MKNSKSTGKRCSNNPKKFILNLVEANEFFEESQEENLVKSVRHFLKKERKKSDEGHLFQRKKSDGF